MHKLRHIDFVNGDSLVGKLNNLIVRGFKYKDIARIMADEHMAYLPLDQYVAIRKVFEIQQKLIKGNKDGEDCLS